MATVTQTPSPAAGSEPSTISPAPETRFPTPQQLLKLVNLGEIADLWTDSWGPEYWLLLGLTRYLNPSSILELGTEYGFSTRLFRAGAPRAEITSIDINDCSHHLDGLNINFRCISSQDLAQTWDTPIDILLIDTDHTKEQVTLELDAFSPFVTRAILLHDIVSFKFDVEVAITDFLARNPGIWTYSPYRIHFGMGILWRNHEVPQIQAP